MNTPDNLIKEIGRCARTEETRTSYSKRGGAFIRSLPPVARREVLQEAQDVIGCHFPDFQSELYLRIANGGFGPGYGLIGVAGGHTADGNTIEKLTGLLRVGERTLPAGVIPVCSWGNLIWSCIDCFEEQSPVLTLWNGSLTRTDLSFEHFVLLWLNGKCNMQMLFDYSETQILNPFTRRLEPKKTIHRARGIPL